MSADRLMERLQGMATNDLATPAFRAASTLALKLLECAPDGHEGGCPKQYGYEHMRCRCDYEDFQAAIEPACRELGVTDDGK